jgi:hypothetical protein
MHGMPSACAVYMHMHMHMHVLLDASTTGPPECQSCAHDERLPGG